MAGHACLRSSLLAVFASSILVLARSATGVSGSAALAAAVPTIKLKNAAQPGMEMPATGLGTGCAIGGCNWGAPKPMASLAMAELWLSIGGRCAACCKAETLLGGVALSHTWCVMDVVANEPRYSFLTWQCSIRV